MESIQKFNSIFVIDFEATCDNSKLFGPAEIIEFPCIQIETKAFQTVDTFHEYVHNIQPEILNLLTFALN